MVIFTNKPGLEHADPDSKVPVSDAVSQLTTLSANVKLKLNLITDTVDTDMVVMDTDTVTDMVMDMGMVTTLERDLLNHTTVMDSTDTAHSVMAQESLDTQEQLPLMLPEAHKDSANRFFKYTE